jgi:hypothetical protein
MNPEGIHSLFVDLQEIINGRTECIHRAKGTALALRLDNVSKLINECEYGEARKEVVLRWMELDEMESVEVRDYRNYVPATLIESYKN